MSRLAFLEGLALPLRIFLEAEREPIPDPDGFILPIGTTLSPREALKQSAILAVAPPWTGKTTVAREIYDALRVHPFSALTCFEEWERGASVEPSWWSSWKTGEDDAFWIVDAVDEDARKDKQSLRILQLLRELPEEALGRLHLLAFCRINEIPAWFETRLEEIYGRSDPVRPLGLRRLRLAGLDRESARAHVGPGRFERVCQLLRDNDLRPLAPFPAVLSYLAESSDDQDLTQVKVWEGVLKNLLREQRDRNEPLHPSFQTEVEDRFAVAQRLAALTTFCGIEPVRPDTGLESLFPSSLPAYAELRVAARETWKTSIFERSDRGYRFSQDHVRQWLTAFALRGMTLRQLRPLLALESGELDPNHEGIAGLLYQITLHEEVKDWLVAIHGGLPGSRDAIWSLPEAARALDKLQEIARTSPWGLSPWRAERLRSFSQVPGIGAEIARRLELDLHPAELQLLLEMAFVAGTLEPLQPAARLLQDEAQDERVRSRAAELLAQLGSEEHLRPLARWVEAMPGIPERNTAVLASLVGAFHDRELWSFEKSADFSLTRSGIEGNWIQYHLARVLSLDHARWLIRKYLLPDPALVSQPLAAKAVEQVLAQDDPREEDGELLQPLLFWKGFRRNRTMPRFNFRSFFARNLTARRKLFLAGLENDPERQQWIWSSALDREDVQWLLELTLDRQDGPTWLWTTLYYIAHESGVPKKLRTRVRREIELRDKELLRRLDRDRRRLQGTPVEAPELYELERLVRETLGSSEQDIGQKMRRLSWLCFAPESDRPMNLSGDWNDLSPELRKDVLAFCRQALIEASPTPESSSIETLWEAACFSHLLKEDPAFVLTPDSIRKWLPGVLEAWESEYESALRRCFEIDRNVSEEILAEAMRRELQRGSTHNFILQQLPLELWSERFASMVQDIVLDGGIAPEAQIDLLFRLGRIFPQRARPIALSWSTVTDAALREDGIDILLMVAPEDGWPLLRALLEKERPEDVLRRMRSLQPNHYGPDADFESWPASYLAELTDLLFRSFPPDSDPKRVRGQVRALGEDDDLREVRDQIPSILIRRYHEEDRAALDTLARRYTRIGEWLKDVHAYQGAEGVLAGLGRGAGRQGRKVPLTLMLKLLQDSQYRVLGSVDDLLDVVQEQLEIIAREAKQHLSLLYHPRPEKGEKRKRLHEDALQAYLHCRLTDRLPAILEAQGVKVAFVDRETLAARDTRNDLKIQASSYEGKPVTLIIEIKWSDNAEVSTSLVEQLGTGYLLENNHTHGIYLVGWSGATVPWKSHLAPSPDPRSSRDAWQESLTEQARRFCEAHAEQGLRIVPFVMDLTWEPVPAPAT